MASKRPRSNSDGAVVSIDDSLYGVVTAAKRRHVEPQPFSRPEQQQQHAVNNTTYSEHAAAHASAEQSSNSSTDGITEPMTDAPPRPHPPPPLPPSAQQRLPSSALMFRPRQLLTTAPATAVPAHQQQRQPITVAAVQELPVLKTIDWRSTDETADRDDMDDSQRDDEDGVDKLLLEGEEDAGSRAGDSAADMELEGVVSRLNSLILPRRITFGRRQPMPIIRPVRLPLGDAVHTA